MIACIRRIRHYISRKNLIDLPYAVHAGQGPRDGFCMVMVCQVFLSAARLDAYVSLVIDLALQSSEMQSSHLLGGRPVGRFPVTFVWVSFLGRGQNI